MCPSNVAQSGSSVMDNTSSTAIHFQETGMHAALLNSVSTFVIPKSPQEHSASSEP